MSDSKKSLLPQGFHDHLPPEAMGEMRLNSSVINRLTLFGYEMVRPALMEFEESLDKDFTSDFFKVTDAISGKMMVIRNDITPQIARIVKDRYGKQALEKTIRLAYTGQVIRKKGSGKFTERQLTQTGYELISEDSAKRDAEILYVAIETYGNAEITDFTIDLCYPKLTKILLDEKNISKKDFQSVIEKIETKDLKELSKNGYANDIIKIIEISDDATDIQSAVKCLKKLESEIKNFQAQNIFKKIREVLEILSSSVSDIKISLNLLEIMDFSYHNGLCYSFISNKTFDEIGRGGRYKITLSKDKNISAGGFTFLINSMLRTIAIKEKMEQKNINYDEGFLKSKSLRDKSVKTIFE